MPYHATPPKTDDPSIDKYFYVCQTKGCGDIINPEYPTGPKNPSPVHCKLCQNPVTRKEIEASWQETCLKYGYKSATISA
jgi:hypothetical protein